MNAASHPGPDNPRPFIFKCTGYTLIELLIIVGIIGILASLAVPVFTGYTSTAQQSKSMEQLNEIAQGMERYFTENRNYPASIASISSALNSDEYFNYSLSNVGTSTYTITATKSSGAARFDLRLNHQGVQEHRTAGSGSWQSGWP